MNKEFLNDLYDTGFKIYQNNNYFKFSLDSLLLAKFVNIDYKDKKILDMCTGNAPIPIMLSLHKQVDITGIEIQKEIYDLACKSVAVNNIKNVNLINNDLKNIKNYFPGNNFDIITCNPPYFKLEKQSVLNDNRIKSIARHEILITLEECIKISYNMLRDKGKLYLVHRNDRMIEIIKLLDKYKFGIKRIQIIYANEKSNGSMLLIEAKKNCKHDIKIMPPIFSNLEQE